MDEPVVLHVDDDPEFGALTATVLGTRDGRFEVLTETDPSAALDRLAETRVDCVVSDYRMPGTDGLAFFEQVRERDPELPFILFTGKGSEEIASEALSRGVTDYLQKEGGTDQFAVLANRVENAVEAVRSRQAAERTERRLSELVANTDDVLYLFSADWSDLLFVNDAYEDLWGQPVDELEADPGAFLDGIVPEDRDRVRAAMDRVSGGETATVEYRVRDGADERWVESRAQPVFEDGEVARVAGFVRDISDRERSPQGQRTDERLAEFAGVLSHDLRNPLNVATGQLALLREECDSDRIERIADAHDRMAALIDDVLAAAREGTQPPEPEPVALADAVADAWHTVGAAEATLVTDLSATVRADRHSLRQLLENLLRNSVEHSSTTPPSQAPDEAAHGPTGLAAPAPAGGPADGTDGTGAGAGAGVDAAGGPTVTVGDLDGGFYVADDGPGIPPEERDRVFEAGYSTADDGTGFGLRIVRRVAEAHGWTVSVTASEAGGARFEVTGVETV